MAQIIECPACSTRYKLNKPIPEEGRKVKCARCAHQWTLLPDAGPGADAADGADDQIANGADGAGAETGAADWQDARPEAGAQAYYAAGGETGDFHEDQDQRYTPEDGLTAQRAETEGYYDAEEVLGGRAARGSSEDLREYAFDREAQDPSIGETLFDPENAAPGGDEEEPQRNWWEDRQSGEAVAYDAEPSEDQREDWIGEARENALRATGAGSSLSAQESWSSRFMGPSWREKPAGEQAVNDEDEDPETIIREAFTAALKNSDSETAGQDAETPPDVGYDEREMHDRSIASALEDYSASAEMDADATSFGRTASASEINPEEAAGPDATSAEFGDYNDRNAFGDAAVTPFPRAGLDERQEFAQPRAGEFGRNSGDFDSAEAADGFDAALDDRLTQLGPEGRTGAEPDDDLYYKQPGSDEYLEYAGDEFRDGENGRIEDEIYGDEIVSNDLEAQLSSAANDYDDPEEESSSRGGLALAAGWAVFLVFLGGIGVGAISFRQDIIAALPGTAGLYGSLGYDVDVKTVDFADVGYSWSEVEGRPMIELRGEVVNVTDQTVPVPPVLVNVQSSSGVPLTAEATVPATELEPRGSVTFTLELVSPPEDVTQIELEFAQVR